MVPVDEDCPSCLGLLRLEAPKPPSLPRASAQGLLAVDYDFTRWVDAIFEGLD